MSIIYASGRCPYCNSNDLSENQEYFSGNYLNIHIVCKKCGKVSRDVFYIEFYETERD